ncbi:hypothetical protein [Trinickia mobilis]|uniref:hypothetical protein n=1 Tax=Trinickia mobilis TaxID=2816356 RepID=UPI001A8F4180|nr:hypothetical protein [Trinickia mobilis]
MNYSDFDSIRWRATTRKQGSANSSDSHAYITAESRETPITKEVRGEGARDIAEALDRAAAHHEPVVICVP